MRLLFDQNLSPRLAERLADVFPGSSHVLDHGLDRASDRDVWDFAQSNGLTITSKDSDFTQIALLNDRSAKVIWLRIGNAPTDAIETIIKRHTETILAFGTDPAEQVLILDPD